jgi:hypothetical protein
MARRKVSRKPARNNARGGQEGLSFDDVRAFALSLPEASERSCYGTPGFYAGTKLFARFHQDRESLVLKMDPDSRDFLTRVNPDVYYFTDHYRNYPLVLVRIAAADRQELQEQLVDAWKGVASRRLLATYEERSSSG